MRTSGPEIIMNVPIAINSAFKYLNDGGEGVMS